MPPLARRCIAVLAAGLVALAPAGRAWADPARILMLGDSLTAGLGLAREDTLPAQLERALHARGWDVEVINAGVSGDTTAGGRARLSWSLGDNPDYAIVALGGNDGLRGLPPEETRRNLDAILTELAARDIPALLVGFLAPRNLGAEYEAEFNAVFPELAEAHGVAFYPFILEGVALDPKLNQPDLIHPNRAGVAIMVRGLTPPVIGLLEVSGMEHRASADS